MALAPLGVGVKVGLKVWYGWLLVREVQGGGAEPAGRGVDAAVLELGEWAGLSGTP